MMAVFQKDKNVLDELLADGSLILFHPGSQALLALNPTGALVWESCDGTRGAEAITRELQLVFPKATGVTEDVDSILSDLHDRGMLTALPQRSR
jgi:hypothetical protein